jgi:hypothetical protein
MSWAFYGRQAELQQLGEIRARLHAAGHLAQDLADLTAEFR